MKRGINDKILSNIMELQDRSVKKIKALTRGDAPFAQEPVKMSDVSNMFRSLDPNDMTQLIVEFGPAEVEKLLSEVRLWEMKQGGQYGGLL